MNEQVALKTGIQPVEADIRDLALVRAYYFGVQGSLAVAAGAGDIYLVCVKEGTARIQTSFIPHPVDLHGNEAVFLAFPRGDWQADLTGGPSTSLYMARMEVARLHELLDPSFDTKRLESPHRFNMRDLMKLIPVSPSLLMSFDQLLYHKLQAPFSSIFEKAKFLEIFSLLMESAFGRQPDQCPVMLSPAMEMRIHQVRRHITDHIGETPDPNHLAILYDLPRNTLKEGYRYLYGKTIHQYHADHKLESAMQMLASGEFLVKEVAFRIGYHNPSHFIAAFKKRYGFTPREYMSRHSGERQKIEG